MTSIRLPADLRNRYEQLAEDLDGFDAPDELARYVLDATADEIGRDRATDAGADRADDSAVADRADDDVVEDRLEQLGYLEK